MSVFMMLNSAPMSSIACCIAKLNAMSVDDSEPFASIGVVMLLFIMYGFIFWVKSVRLPDSIR